MRYRIEPRKGPWKRSRRLNKARKIIRSVGLLPLPDEDARARLFRLYSIFKEHATRSII